MLDYWIFTFASRKPLKLVHTSLHTFQRHLQIQLLIHFFLNEILIHIGYAEFYLKNKPHSEVGPVVN